MKKKIGTAILISFLFPYIITLTVSGTAAAEQSKEAGQSGRKIYLDREEGGYVDLEDYLPGVIARQIPADYEPEVLKAQAILARTYIRKQMGDGKEIAESALDLDFLEEEQLKALWGTDRFVEYYKKMESAAEDTAGMVIAWNGELIDPLFCRASAGKTRSGDSYHPYLASADSARDVEADGYLQVVTWSKEEFARLLSALPEGEAITADMVPGCVQVVSRDGAGYVEEIQIGSVLHSGDRVQYALGLQSPDFSIEEYQGGVRAVSSGIGHGYGLSQYGGNVKAKEGWTAQDILEYYYKNIVLISE
ncbi:MAG: SpoIID/LytB domain-containing protein [Lachnospiraceae bacterium]|jgi:stage II sporulation protein D|nr:SpoIID/LytB domain-containing protein [Lachnospiraceae bacterium]MCI9591052.1 SpoIID/LytB domain-containing protein [Lachnospiraceae bacterium]MDE6929547.1 SpoIID/LytB domain-containing protein [Lachnospiraceae bacterium]